MNVDYTFGMFREKLLDVAWIYGRFIKENCFLQSWIFCLDVGKFLVSIVFCF